MCVAPLGMLWLSFNRRNYASLLFSPFRDTVDWCTKMAISICVVHGEEISEHAGVKKLSFTYEE